MGIGIELAKQLDPRGAELIESLKEQLLIVFLKRLGGKCSIPCSEIDDTGMDIMMFSVDENRMFHFETKRKN